MTTQKGLLYEHWVLINDTTLHNKSYRVHQRDTVPQETVVLALNNGRITYASTVANQNNQENVVFTLGSIDNGKYIFENKAHDFPQVISYQLSGGEKLSAAISGKIKNSFREILFDYTRER